MLKIVSVKIEIYYIDGKMSKIVCKDSVKIKMFTSVLWTEKMKKLDKNCRFCED